MADPTPTPPPPPTPPTPPIPPVPVPSPSTQGGLQIPPELQQKYGDLLELIKHSESMNDEERQYWINILPIMTPEQIQNLRDILENERKQLAAIDAKYQTEIEKLGEAEVIRQTEEERRTRRLQRSSTEATHKEKEDAAADDLLKQIEDTGQTGKAA